MAETGNSKMLLTMPLGSLWPGLQKAAAADMLVARLFTADEDRDALFALRLQSFRAAGLDVPADGGLYKDRYDDLATTLIAGVYLGRQPVGTLRICFWKPGAVGLSLPCEAVYPEVDRIKRSANGIVVEIARLAVEPSLTTTRRTAVYAQVVRLGIMACLASDVAVTLVATHQKSKTFYQRIFGFSLAAGPQPYPPGDEPIILLAQDFRTANKRLAMRNPFFRIKQAEIDELHTELSRWRRANGL